MPAEEGSLDGKSSPYVASTAISRRSKLNASETTRAVLGERNGIGIATIEYSTPGAAMSCQNATLGVRIKSSPAIPG
jgi:hypothetical protein